MASLTGSGTEALDRMQTDIEEGRSKNPEAVERTNSIGTQKENVEADKTKNADMSSESVRSDKTEYDHSEQWKAVVLEDGAAFVGGVQVAGGWILKITVQDRQSFIICYSAAMAALCYKKDTPRSLLT